MLLLQIQLGWLEMKKIIDYAAVMADEHEVFNDLVKEYLVTGWRPCGGICINLDDLGYPALYTQAMVKYEEDN